ncbi:putative NADPH-quinone reductase (modulator of drug activity B) [Saccharomonospora marina XMU15]|uniref:Putative NADPH-quinone reductase (Modulator of drug activity B) n=2 Tax=Saccharomonospora TaxID=1851 RepID=H5X9I8_9PSEU|nr:putative NADPH-quinone reductase (modulator of drug activity B) [Saccharomonospora marina XMU15]
MLEVMNVLWLFAHPEPRSLNAALKDDGVRTLTELGHQVRVHDLYAMKWDPVVQPCDYGHDPDERLLVSKVSRQAHAENRLSADIRAEQQAVRWADTLVVQFPMWWFGMPAILKGWFDRVFVNGFAFGVADPVTGRTMRYGDGGLAGKRAMVLTTIGARESSFGPRGIHGELCEVLFGVHHGIFFYSGIEALPPLAVYGADRADEADFVVAAERLRQRLAALQELPALPFRHENSGDYDADLVLLPHLAPGETGVSIHSRHGD